MKTEMSRSARYQRIANIISVALVVFISAAFILETHLAGFKFNPSAVGLIIIASLATLISVIKYSREPSKMAFNVPFVLTAFYTLLLLVSRWNFDRYFMVLLVLCGISCLYSNFTRSVVYVVIQNLLVGFLIFKDIQVAGTNTTLQATLIAWLGLIVADVILLLLTRSGTVVLNKALENQTSFRDLLATTENYVAMIDEHNEVVYASKTLSRLGNIGDSLLVQGRPLIDLFPGRALKVFAGKMLKEKGQYAEDWEFSLNGQKRYFKAASHSLPGHTGNALISLYDMTHLAERDEIAAMKDSMKIGLFFIDQNYVIQDHYSRYLEEMLDEKNLFGKLLTDIIHDSVTPPELEAIKDYFSMVLERSYDQDMLEDINPLNELHYINVRTGGRKVFQFSFATVERGRGEIFLLVTVYDITLRVELQKRLQEEEARRQEEMQSVFELIQVAPDVFADFEEDMDFEFGSIDKILKDNSLSSHEALVKVYQSVHAIKSNAVILGLNVFGNKVHTLESKIKKLREQEKEVPFVEMLNLALDIEKLAKEREGFKVVIEKLQSYGGGSGESNVKQNVKVLIDSLAKTTSRVSEDNGKLVQFTAVDIDPEAISKGPRRVMKEVLMQFIRNSVVHGIEMPEVRKERGKSETGLIKLTITIVDNCIQIKCADDGNGLDYPKIAQKAIEGNIINEDDANNQNMLLKAIFAPGFSTAETEGIHAGRGIGLNLVRDRIKETGGTIKLRSEAGKGTVFTVSIPLKP
jgi:two-component system chemotaxis sensor kinase CheA